MIEDSLEKYFWVMLKRLKGYFSNDIFTIILIIYYLLLTIIFYYLFY